MNKKKKIIITIFSIVLILGCGLGVGLYFVFNLTTQNIVKKNLEPTPKPGVYFMKGYTYIEENNAPDIFNEEKLKENQDIKHGENGRLLNGYGNRINLKIYKIGGKPFKNINDVKITYLTSDNKEILARKNYNNFHEIGLGLDGKCEYQNRIYNYEIESRIFFDDLKKYEINKVKIIIDGKEYIENIGNHIFEFNKNDYQNIQNLYATGESQDDDVNIFNYRFKNIKIKNFIKDEKIYEFYTEIKDSTISFIFNKQMEYSYLKIRIFSKIEYVDKDNKLQNGYCKLDIYNNYNDINDIFEYIENCNKETL